MISAMCNSTRSFRWALALAVLAIVAAATPARADSETFTDSVSIQPTNFTASVSIPRFDPSLGTLTSIDFTLMGTVLGTAKFESEDAAPSTVITNLQATIKLERPDLSTVTVVLPTVTTSTSVTAFDGVVDFGGTSGRTFTGQTSSATSSISSPPPLSDLLLFTGLTNIVLPVLATGTSTGSGNGNLDLSFRTNASAVVTVTYNYTPLRAVPEPSSFALIGLGGAGLALIRLRRSRRAA